MIEKDALQLLIDTAKSAGAVHVVSVPEPKGTYAIRQPDGRLEFMTADPDHRQHVARDLQAIILFAERFAGTAAIWYDRDGIVCVLDDVDEGEGDRDHRQNAIKLPLAVSVPLKTLQSWDGRLDQMNQEQAVRLMRTTFADCLAGTGNLAEIIRSVKITVEKVAEGTVKQGKSSLGSSLRAEVDGYERLPDYVTFTVPVFAASFDYKAPVKCALEVFPQTGNFAFIPLPGEIERAFAAAEDCIQATLSRMMGDGEQRTQVPVYYGKDH